MVVVSDTSPLRYLVEIGLEELLVPLFGEILIPAAVRSELMHPSAPPAVNQWISAPPAWLRITDPGELPGPSAAYVRHRGEQEVFQLASQCNASLLLIDDVKARQTAEQKGFAVTGVIGILARAAQRNLIDLEAALYNLRQTNFRVSDDLLTRLRKA